MTICVAAIGKCEEFNSGNEAIVFATDHMISLDQIGQFEHAVEKYRKINENTIAMLSGETLLFEEALNGVSKEDDFEIVKEKIHQNMIKIRDKRIKKSIFDKLKIDFNYLGEILKNPQHNPIINNILEEIKQFDLKTTILLIGFKDNKAHLIEINEFDAINTRDINFDAIGSGGTQAINTLLFQKHSKLNNIKTTLYNVYKAKKNSEVAVGVGKETDLFILTANGKICKINENQIKILNDIYKEEMKCGIEHKKLNTILKEMDEILNV